MPPNGRSRGIYARSRAACYAVAAATCAATSSSSSLPLHVHAAAAFVPSAAGRHRQARQIQIEQIQIHRAVQGRHAATSSLSSSVVDETTDAAAAASDSSADSKAGDKDVGAAAVVARGEVVYFTPGPIGSVAAVRLNDEDVLANGALAGKAAATAAADSSEGSSSGGGGPGVFGAPAGAAKQGNQKQQKQEAGRGDDFVGRTVQFPNGKTGVVIAERPPIAFVMCDSTDADVDVDDADSFRQKDAISVLSSMATLPVSDSMFGKIVDCRGRVQGEEKDDAAAEEEEEGPFADRAIFAPIPKVSDIALINSPMLTGKATVDALAPLGKGQNTLVVASDGAESRALVIDAIAAQVRAARSEREGAGSDDDGGVRCVYGLTSSDPAVRADVLRRLDEAGVRDDVVVVAAREGSAGEGGGEDGAVRASAEAISVAAAACAVGEAHALAKGRDALVVIDSIDGHKDLWDWTTRVLVEVYGVDAVVKDDRDGGASSEMRAFYSALIQRAARFNARRGGGSVTLAMLTTLPGRMDGAGDEGDERGVVFSPEDFDGSSDKVKERIAILTKSNIPLTAANLRKIQIPVPAASESERTRRLALQHVDDLISMSDGQIWLDEDLAKAGQRPPVDPQRSITRIGIGADTMSRADAPAMRGLAGGLRFELAQAASLEGAGEGSGADWQLRRRDAWMLAMHQEAGDVRDLSENAVALLAASTGALDGVVREGGTAGTEAGVAAVGALLDFVRTSAPDAMDEIDSTLDLTQDVRTKLEGAISAYFAAKA